jgi:hypothetical protein
MGAADPLSGTNTQEIFKKRERTSAPYPTPANQLVKAVQSTSAGLGARQNLAACLPVRRDLPSKILHY